MARIRKVKLMRSFKYGNAKIMIILGGKTALGLLSGIIAALILTTLSNQSNAQPEPLDVGVEFVASGWMGDGERGRKNIELIEASEEDPHSPPFCIKIAYTPGASGWAGIYWQNEPDNWGRQAGEDLSGAGFRRLTFWARGARGNEIVEFLSGGSDSGLKYKDSFEARTKPRRISLTQKWKQYEINLEGKNLSSVIGGFAWVASQSSNPNGLTFYLDDILFE
jgi:hypothetical protein